MTTGFRSGPRTINIFEVGSTLTEIECFHIREKYFTTGDFSQTTYRISYSDPFSNHLDIWDIRGSRYLLEEEGHFSLSPHCFSPDGSLFAAPEGWGFQIWKYTSGRYARWREFSLRDRFACPKFNSLRFSPTSSSLLGCLDGIVTLWRLGGPPIDAHHDSRKQFVILSRCSSYIVASHKEDCVVTITNLLSQTLPCVIDTGMAITELALTGNILLAVDSDTTAAWQLTEEGMVDGVCADGRAEHGNTIWTIPTQPNSLCLHVQDQAAYIVDWETPIYGYHTETGEALKPVLLNSHRNHIGFSNDTSLDDLSKYGWDISSGGGGPLSWNTPREGWVKDPEGNHLLWLPVEWRDPERIASHDSTVVWFDLAPHNGTFRTVIIKF
ncbi:hypothetical protein BDM02DRAFT_3272001 [Thelephora ganbajun]|uniref:Uncharacterized protein n=1 Tax=Thelephora ganbajun TaxID=370292 RepID=A0ACB6Z6C0_THEGA|nr:hypothetical protein BDM02DRAFT_3272001 [Thelephora ganbajun]